MNRLISTLAMQTLVALSLTWLPASQVAAGVVEISIDPVTIDTGEFRKAGIGYNGVSPGPVLRLKEGEEAIIKVTNNLDESTSIHWHGLILPFQMDGVPTISYDGIAPGETFTYRFPVVQSGTYWFHSHTALQEPDGAYGPIVIESKGREPFRYDQDYVVQLADMHPHAGSRVMRNLKMMPDYYNRKQQTVADFFRDVTGKGFDAAVAERQAWGEMRMMRTDVEDVQGFISLINGFGPEQNWTALFKPGDRVRLRLINSSAMTYYDVRIPGLQMTVVQADGNNVQPVKVDELRIGVAETYDVIVHPKEDRAYTIFAESMGRTGFARGTLAPREGMEAEVPVLRAPPLLTMADMPMAGHAGMAGMDHSAMAAGSAGGMDHSAMAAGSAGGMDHSAMAGGSTGGMDHSAMAAGSTGGMDHSAMAGGSTGGMDHSAMAAGSTGGMDHSAMAGGSAGGMDHSAMGHGAMAGGAATDAFYAAGSGLIPAAANGGRFLSYGDLKAQRPLYEFRPATREIELRLTGNMERYIWSINGIKYEDADPIRLQYGERVRFKFVNETMMTHPMHLHGMWTILDTGAEKWNPIKHVVSVAPGTTVYTETEVDAPGQWAFHCHLAYHSKSGMFRKVIVEGGPKQAQLDSATAKGG